MPGVKVREGESFESALKRFKKECENAGLIIELKKREHYEKPIIFKKRKIATAKRKMMKKIAKVRVYTSKRK